MIFKNDYSDVCMWHEEVLCMRRLYSLYSLFTKEWFIETMSSLNHSYSEDA